MSDLLGIAFGLICLGMFLIVFIETTFIKHNVIGTPIWSRWCYIQFIGVIICVLGVVCGLIFWALLLLGEL